VERGGIIGRGVLLDYVSFCQRHSITVDALESSAIPLAHMEMMVQEQDITFRTGDILFIRMGYTKAYNALDEASQEAIALRTYQGFLGLESSSAMLQWLWTNGFAAVVGDAPSFEQAPVEGYWPGRDLEEQVKEGGLLHQVLLGGWGMPIGEMFDLESLAETCSRLGRSSFFLTSVPLKVPRGVASPPNAMAIF
jgi:hypothetical protein